MTGLGAPLVIGLIGTATSAIGAISSGAAQKRASDYNAAVGQMNAKVSRQGAAENFKRQQRLNAKNISTIRNRPVVSMDVLEDNVREAELMALDILYEGELKAQGYESGAALDRMKGKTAQTAGFASAAGSLLKGAGAAYDAGAFSSTTTPSVGGGAGFAAPRLGAGGGTLPLRI